ncbi:MAG: IS1634 family transposase, partial [Victivallaceae bacterium]
EARYKFFRLLSKRRAEKEFWVYDTTSISSYSEQLKQVKRGHNKEHDLLAQFNLAMVFGEQSMLPFYYRKMSGNMADVTTVKQLVAELDSLDFIKIKLVMDRGFYSALNLSGLYQEHIKFLIATRMSLKFIRRNLESIYDNFRSFEHYHEGHKVYARTVRTTWDYTQERPYKKDVIESQKRLYIHYYYNITKAAEKEQKFDSELNSLRQELLSGKHVEQHQDLYDKYYVVRSTPKRGVKVEVKADVVAQEKRYMGFFALLSNEAMTAFEALDIYRNKDLIEKAFGNLKERLNMRRALVSSEESLNGKLFVEFIALIYLSELQKRMRGKKMFEQYTLQGVLDELDLIECYEVPGKRLQVAEVLKKQTELYHNLDITPPASL